ncbi:MAG: S-adenosyl-l-methionine hydroxide adenosyltransferase family protein [Vicinamibacterales bacterium]
MSRPVVAFLTDFGTRDHYVAAMKGVVLAICPDAALVDVTHDIPAHDIDAAGLELAACYKYFPPGTIFVVVVDPGVGSSRRAMAAEAGEHRFIAPDNGVLTAVFAETPPRRVVDLTDRRYARPTVSRTFEGRDRFAPAAGWLARGAELSALGRPVTTWREIALVKPRAGEREIEGEVRRVDRFGNLVTNIDRRTFDKLTGRDLADGALEIAAGGHPVRRLVAAYAEAPPGEPCALFGSTDHLEIAINGGSAAAVLGIGKGAPVRVAIRT